VRNIQKANGIRKASEGEEDVDEEDLDQHDKRSEGKIMVLQMLYINIV